MRIRFYWVLKGMGIIQCLLHPTIPWQGAPQQSRPPFRRVTVVPTESFYLSAKRFLDCVWVWIAPEKTTEKIKPRLSLATLLQQRLKWTLNQFNYNYILEELDSMDSKDHKFYNLTKITCPLAHLRRCIKGQIGLLLGLSCALYMSQSSAQF